MLLLKFPAVNRNMVVMDIVLKLGNMATLLYVLPYFDIGSILYCFIFISFTTLINAFNRRNIYTQLMQQSFDYNEVFLEYYKFLNFNYKHDTIRGKMLTQTYWLALPFILLPTHYFEREFYFPFVVFVLLEAYILKSIYNKLISIDKNISKKYLIYCLIYTISVMPLFYLNSIRANEFLFIMLYIPLCATFIRQHIYTVTADFNNSSTIE